MRKVTSTRGRPSAAGGSTSTPVTRPVAASHCGRQPISARPCAISSPPVRSAGAAPQIDHQRARPVAMILRIAAQHLVGRGLAEIEGGRRRHGARIGGEQVAAGRQHVGAAARRRAGRAGRDVAAVERGKQRARARPRRSACAAGRLRRARAAVDVQPVLDGEILEVAEPGIDPAQRRRPGASVAADAGFAGKPGLGARSRRSASPAGRGGGGRARRPAHIRRPAAPASAGVRRARRRSAAAAGGRCVTAAMRRLACAASPGLLTMKG